MKTNLDLWCIVLVDDEDEKTPDKNYGSEKEKEIIVAKEKEKTKKTREEILDERKKKAKGEIDKLLFFLFEHDYITEDDAQKYLERMDKTLSLLSLIEIKEDLKDLKESYLAFFHNPIKN